MRFRYYYQLTAWSILYSDYSEVRYNIPSRDFGKGQSKAEGAGAPMPDAELRLAQARE